MKSLLIGIAAIATWLGTPALAADMPVKAPPPPAPVSPWTGFYVGANAGAGWLDDPAFTTAPGGTLVSSPFESSLGWGEAISGSRKADFTGGGQIGYNQQLNGNWVAGFEADIQYLGASTSAANTFVASLPPQPATTLTNSFSSKTPWFGTVRARVGTTALNPNLLLYVTGGLAFGSEQFTGLVNAVGPIGSEIFPFSRSQFLGGYAVGGGGEWAISSHWSIKAEYLFVQLGLTDQQVRTTIVNASDLSTDAVTLSAKHDDISVARVGLNYRF
jgi:outer membrane immunogenic protein